MSRSEAARIASMSMAAPLPAPPWPPPALLAFLALISPTRRWCASSALAYSFELKVNPAVAALKDLFSASSAADSLTA
jgi:hypothetical protein